MPVPRRIADAGALARTGVPHVADLETRSLELRLRGGDVRDAQGDRRRWQRGELVVVRVWRHDGEREVPGLVLDPVVGRRVRIPAQAEELAVEAARLVDVSSPGRGRSRRARRRSRRCLRVRRVPLVQRQRVPVRIGEVRHVADARVEGLTLELHTLLLELGARGGARRRREAGRCCSPAGDTRRRTAPARQIAKHVSPTQNS